MRVQQAGEVNFGHQIVFDIGASDKRRASCKLALLNDAGKVLDTYEGKLSDTPFKKDSDFVAALTKRLIDFEARNKEKIDTLKGKDRELRKVTGFAPGGTIGNKARIITNLVKTGNKSLENIDYNTIPNALRQAFATSGITIAQDLDFKATNDMIGTGAALAKQLGKMGRLEKGYHAAFYMIGGGAGCGEIDVIGGKVVVKSVERAHTHVSGKGNNMKTFESAGASSNALVKYFAQNIGLSEEETKKLVDAGNAKVFAQRTIVTSDKKEIRTLTKTGLYTKKVEKGKTYLTLKNVTVGQFQQASKKTINKFINVMAKMNSDRIVEGTNHVILTGPLVTGIGKDLEHNPELFGGKSLMELIRAKTSEKLNAQGHAMATDYSMEIIELPLKNNTYGGHWAGKGKFTSDKRGNWLEIPISLLQRAKKAVKQVAKAV